MDASRAVLFDLDETLYRERRYALGAFRAVAAGMAEARRVPALRLFSTLTWALRRGHRATALQALCDREGWPAATVPMLVDMMRAHEPSLRLPAASRRVLERMRHDWRTAIVTNGYPAVQRRKVRALGLERLVDTIVFASECGDGTGKPESAPFLEAARSLGVRPQRCVFVGDDPARDVAGASRVGMKTILITRPGNRERALSAGIRPDAIVDGLEEVPFAASSLIEGAGARCA